MNQRIRAREVRVIGADNEQLGIMPPQEALKVAVERGLDLVEVAQLQARLFAESWIMASTFIS